MSSTVLSSNKTTETEKMINLSLHPQENAALKVHPEIHNEQNATTIKIDDTYIFMYDSKAKELAEMILKVIGDKNK